METTIMGLYSRPRILGPVISQCQDAPVAASGVLECRKPTP